MPHLSGIRHSHVNRPLTRVEILITYLIYKTYYMALSHKDWELPNSRIWLAETDIDRGLDFPI